MPHLATLNLQGCSRVGDRGIAHLAAMPELRHILLPAGVSDASMQLLADMPGGARHARRRAGAGPACWLACPPPPLPMPPACGQCPRHRRPTTTLTYARPALARCAALERVALRCCTQVTTAGVYLLLQVSALGWLAAWRVVGPPGRQPPGRRRPLAVSLASPPVCALLRCSAAA